MKQVFFVTGVTGFLGQEIVDILAKEDEEHTFYCLIRSTKTHSSEERLREILLETGLENTGRMVAVDGDIRKEKLGIDADLYLQLTREVTQIIHSAADVRFNQPIEKIRAINVQGTQHICELAEDCKENNPLFSQLNYIGTAFVAGKKTGIAGEDELSDESGFKNTYEQTKYEAEVLVRAYRDKGLPVMIFRPSIVVGVSETGKAKPRNVIYPMLKYFLQWNVPVISVNTAARLDIVPVDFVAKAFVYISANKEHIGRCFHLTAGPEGNLNLKRMIQVVSRGLNKRVYFIPQSIWAAIVRPVLKRVKPSLYNNATLPAFTPYIQLPSPIYSVQESEKALQGSGIHLPDKERFLMNCIHYALKTDFGSKPLEPSA